MSYYIIIRGPLGSGKSTIAAELARKIGAKQISIDRVLDDHHLTEDKEDGFISQRSFIRANEIVVPEIKKTLDKNTPVIFDGNFYWKSQLDDLIERLDYPHYVFTLKVPLEVCIQRDRDRNKTHGSAAAQVVYKKSTAFEYGIPVDATQSLPGILAKILAEIGKYEEIA